MAKRLVGPVVVGAVLVTLTGCIGTTSRDEFAELVAERGGGVSTTVVDGLRAVLAAELGTPDPAIRSLRIDFLTAMITVEARNPAAPNELDQYTIRGDELLGVDPVVLTGDIDLDATTVPLGAVALDAIETMADEALAAFGATGGHVVTLSISATSEPVQVSMYLASPRSTADATFDATGRLLGVER